MIKQAVILAAGNGKRMAQNSSDEKLKTIPKPLLEVNEMPMIEKKIKTLSENGVAVAVVINPVRESIFGEKLKAYEIKYCYQPNAIGTANALYSAKDFVRDDLFIVMVGDDVVEYDIKSALQEDGPVVFGFDVDDLTGYGALVVNRRGEVENILEKQKSGRGVVNTGVYVMPREFFDHYSEVSALAVGEDRLTDVPKILSGYGIKFRLRKLDSWYGVNTPTDLTNAIERLKGR
jgi:NDP-sugar pyrophosphorylase family protein